MELDVVPLHKHLDHIMQCCELINQEWKRSVTARMRSLESSRDNLPTNLILIKRKTQVIGHCKLTPIPSMQESCFIESVVIDKKLRGLGYGKRLMERAEDYCRDFLKLKTIYLSTKGQEGFYSKLGYVECTPVSIYGGFIPANNNNLIYSSKNVNQHVPVPPPMPKGVVRSKDPDGRKVFMKKDIA